MKKTYTKIEGKDKQKPHLFLFIQLNWPDSQHVPLPFL